MEIACLTVLILGFVAVKGKIAGSQTQPTDETVSQTPMNSTGKRRSSLPFNGGIGRANVERNSSQSWKYFAEPVDPL